MDGSQPDGREDQLLLCPRRAGGWGVGVGVTDVGDVRTAGAEGEQELSCVRRRNPNAEIRNSNQTRIPKCFSLPSTAFEFRASGSFRNSKLGFRNSCLDVTAVLLLRNCRSRPQPRYELCAGDD